MDNKTLDKDVLPILKKKGLFKKGDYTLISELSGRSRQHIKIVMVDNGTTTQSVIDCILKFYSDKAEEHNAQKETVKVL